jgi:hypothetical protein
MQVDLLVVFSTIGALARNLLTSIGAPVRAALVATVGAAPNMAWPAVPAQLRTILTYENSLDAWLNYTLIAVTWLCGARVLARSGGGHRYWLLASLFFVLAQLGFCHACRCTGVSGVWSAQVGALWLLTASTCGGRPRPVLLTPTAENVVASLGACAAWVYYSETAPQLTSAVHCAALLLGALVSFALAPPPSSDDVTDYLAARSPRDRPLNYSLGSATVEQGVPTAHGRGNRVTTSTGSQTARKSIEAAVHSAGTAFLIRRGCHCQATSHSSRKPAESIRRVCAVSPGQLQLRARRALCSQVQTVHPAGAPASELLDSDARRSSQEWLRKNVTSAEIQDAQSDGLSTAAPNRPFASASESEHFYFDFGRLRSADHSWSG